MQKLDIKTYMTLRKWMGFFTDKNIENKYLLLIPKHIVLLFQIFPQYSDLSLVRCRRSVIIFFVYATAPQFKRHCP